MPVSRLDFSTRTLAPRDQRAAWRAWFHPVFDLAWAPEERNAPFEADIDTWMFGGAAFSRVVAPSLHSVRSPIHVRRDPTDHWVIGLGSAVSDILLPNRDLRIRPNAPFLVSLADPRGKRPRRG